MALTANALVHVLGQVQIIESMYFGDEFRWCSDDDTNLYEQLQRGDEADGCVALSASLAAHSALCFQVRVPLESTGATFVLQVRVPLGTDSGSALDVALPSSENSWLGRADQQHLSEECHATHAKIMHDDPELETAFVVTTLVDSMRHLAQPLADAWQDKAATDAAAESAPQGPIAAIREWLWFPMIYTREKRGNIVDWAPRYKLTGFLFAGKPGCLCLEGTEKDVNAFLKDIKTVSWSDIPAGHKKISTRWQQRFTVASMAELDKHRIFHDMQELIFEASGKFKNHNDLAMLKKWMNEHNVGEAFTYLFDYE